jgi:Prenyltransferase and squalene oxidase repeat
MSFQPAAAIDFIRTHQNPDGGWGYAPGRTSFVEPAAFGLLAAGGNAGEPLRSAGLRFLRSCQKSDGGLGLNAQAVEGSWMSYAALLAFHALGADPEKRRLQNWSLNFEDASGRFTKDELAATQERYRYDASIPGWSWTPRTTAWIEPTALFIIALVRVGVPLLERRIRSGVDLILDRRVPSGGWNYGNPFSLSYELEASPMSTALALAALGAAGVPGTHPAVGAGLRYLEGCLAHDVSTASLAWTVLALKAFPSGARRARDAASRLARLQTSDGAFRDNPFETALAYLVLTDAPILFSPAGGGR